MTASTRVKILFNSESQRSYVSNNLEARFGLKSTKTETLHLNMFGETSFQKQKCSVLTLLFGNLNDETSRTTLKDATTLGAMATKILVLAT